MDTRADKPDVVCQYRYLHYDVFTDRPLTGNQLAVFTDPAGLTTDDMARITREMNFSECTFLFPPNSRVPTFVFESSPPMARCPSPATR